jgi:hypothetical protein
MSIDRLMDREELLDIFDYMNKQLAENQLVLELTVYGGAIMTLVYDNRPATKDIDCVFSSSNEDLLNNIFELTKFTFNLPAKWINEDIREPLKSLLIEDKETFKLYSNLRILKPIPEQLLAMKVLAARAEPSKDFIDAYILCKDLNIQTKEELFNVCSKYVPLNLIGERQMKFIQYLGKDLGYDWK